MADGSMNKEEIEKNVRTIVNRNLMGADSFAIKGGIINELTEYINRLVNPEPFTPISTVFTRIVHTLYNKGHSKEYILEQLEAESKRVWKWRGLSDEERANRFSAIIDYYAKKATT